MHGPSPNVDDFAYVFGTNLTASPNGSLWRNEDGGDDTHDDYEEVRFQRLKWVAYGIVAPFLIVVGIVGNVLNLIVLTRPNLKGVMYTYLLWLAISDMMSLVFTIPTLVRFVGIARQDYYSSWYHAHVELAVVNAFMACSVFIVVAVTVDRFFSVSRPTKFKSIHTQSRARLWIFCSYTGAFLLYLPVCFFREVHPVVEINSDNTTSIVRYEVRENEHMTSHPAWTVYLWFKESLVRLGPSLVLACLNVLIIVAFQRVVRKRKALLHNSRFSHAAPPGGSPRPNSGESGGSGSGGGGTSSGGGGSAEEERRLVMLLIGIVVVFVVTMTPAAFLTLFSSSRMETSFSFQVFRAFANNMEFVNYAMNFYLYCLCSSEIRSTFLRMFHFFKSKPLLLNRNNNAASAGLHNRGADGVGGSSGCGGGNSLPPPQSFMDDQPTTTVLVDSKI